VIKVTLVKTARVDVIVLMAWDVTTSTDSVQMGIVMLDGNQAHVLKVKNFLYKIVY
jgi:hypothetical protein